MLSLEQIKELVTFEGAGRQVLSAYLDLDPARRPRRSYRVVLEDLVQQAREQLPEATRRDLENEAARVRAWLEAESPRGRGLALISCAPRAFWQAHVLQVPVRDHLAFEPKPDVAPLIKLLDEYERYAVALVDKEHARLFVVFVGEIEEREAFEDEVPGKHDQGGMSQARYQRHHDTHVYWHLKRVAQRLAELHRRRAFDRLILAGPEEPTGALRHLLPRSLAHRLVAVIPAEVFAGEAEILEKTLDIERRVEREAEESLLGQLFDMAGPGQRATLGVRATLDAVWGDVVQTVVVADGAHGAGSECPSCGRLEPGRAESCPTCGSAIRSVHDLFHRVIERAQEQSAGVEVVHGDAARRLLETANGLGPCSAIAGLRRKPAPTRAEAR